MRNGVLSSNLRLLLMALVCTLACSPLHADDPAPIKADSAPLRYTPGPSITPIPLGAKTLYIDPEKGSDQADGKAGKPWRTLKHAVSQLKPGDTLLLAAGVYREPAYIAIQGTPEKPITLRAQPGAIVTIDTGLAEFVDSPSTAWQPVDNSPGEYVSTNTYPNIRDVIGRFAATGIGLQTYWHRMDLTATNEIWALPKEKDKDIDPIYVGPGIWYNPATSKIHARLAHTHVPGISNYQAGTDPRQTPLIIAPFRATPLTIDGASNLIIQDIVLRGAGYEAVQIYSGTNITLERVTVYSGTYGLRVSNTQGLRFIRSAILGNAAPWCFRQENSLRNRPGRGLRDVARMNVHALWVPDTGREFSVFAIPTNDNFEIAYSLFCDSHDGLYLGGVATRFHHNIVENCHDDGLYIAPMYPYGQGEVHIYQNLIRGCLTPLAFGSLDPHLDTIYIYRNIIDQRMPVGTARPSTPGGPASFQTSGSIMGDHASPEWAKMFIYQNTVIMGGAPRQATGGFYVAVDPKRPRQVFNNLFIHPENLIGYALPKDVAALTADGNLFWAPKADAKSAAGFFTRARASDAFKASQTNGSAGLDINSIVADPRLTLPDILPVSTMLWSSGDAFKPGPGSPAIGAGVPLPPALPDPLRQSGKPDIGALPANGPALQVGPDALPSLYEKSLP